MAVSMLEKTKGEIETLIASIHISFYILQEKVAKSEEKIGGQGWWKSGGNDNGVMVSMVSPLGLTQSDTK